MNFTFYLIVLVIIFSLKFLLVQTHCQDLGGYLLSIESEQESQVMTSK